MKSMTGFGKESLSVGPYQFDFEIKSVNHRFLDIQIRLPREYNQFELSLRQEIKQSLQRGRVECWLYVKKEGAGTKELEINWHLLDQLVKQLDQASETRYRDYQFDPKLLLANLSSHGDFFSIVEKEELDVAVEDHLLKGIQGALLKLNESRLKEGEHIRAVLGANLNEFSESLVKLQSLAKVYEAEHYEKLREKVSELVGGEIDEQRLLTEVALIIERGDINEELDRLVIHRQNFSELLTAPGSIGREMDFLIQEMNREVNTVGSKSAPIAIKEIVVQLKTTLEKIREQVQNIE